jgi:hypothetical protein
VEVLLLSLIIADSEKKIFFQVYSPNCSDRKNHTQNIDNEIEKEKEF